MKSLLLEQKRCIQVPIFRLTLYNPLWNQYSRSLAIGSPMPRSTSSAPKKITMTLIQHPSFFDPPLLKIIEAIQGGTLAILKHIFSIAERKNLLQTNVAKKVRIPDPQNERDRVLTPEEWDRFIEAAAFHIKPIILIAYHLGMRLGEILKLTWDRVDLERGFIRLAARDTKTGKPRLVPMTPAIQRTLQELAKVKSLMTNRVFLYKGKPLGEVKTAVKTAIKRAGIQDFRFHDLRHCAATNLRRAGVDTVTAMKIVGHKSEKMHRRYNNVSETDLLLAASKLNTLITPAVSSAPTKIVNH